VSRHPSGYYYAQKVTGARTMEKLLAENIKLQRQLKVTRQNNSILRKQKSDLTLANEEIQGRLQEIKSDFATGNAELIIMKQKFAELKKNNTEISSDLTSSRKEKDELMNELQDVDKELDDEIKIRLQCQSEKLELVAKDLTNQQLVLDLKTNISKITSELQMRASENADLVWQQKTQILFGNKELEDCKEELEDKIQKNDHLELENSVISKSLQESKQEAMNNQTVYKKCQESLELEIKEKTELMESLQEVDKELDAEVQIRLKCQSEKLELVAKDLTNQKLVFELKTNITKTASELEMRESGNTDLVVANKELEDCKEELKEAIQKNDELELDNSVISKSFQESKQEATNNQTAYKKCQESLEDEIKEKTDLQALYANNDKEILKLKTNLNETQEEVSNCKKTLQEYKNRINVFRPAWSDWSDCSKTCFGIKTRIEKCQDNHEQIQSCNQDSACSRSGKSLRGLT